MNHRFCYRPPAAALGWLALIAVGVSACADGSAARGVSAAQDLAAEVHEHAHGEEAIVLLDSTALAIANIQLSPVEAVEARTLSVTGSITYDANHLSHIGPRTEGRIVGMHADLGSRVQGGQPLAILESPEVGQLRATEREAEVLLAIAREHFEREGRLEQQGISSRKELLEAEAELRRMEAALQRARESLRVLGAGHGSGGEFALTAPFSGVVVSRDAGLGEVVSPADRLFTVADLSRLWIELDIFERSLMQVAKGQKVRITTAAYPGRIFPGEIVYIGETLDPATRTVRARVEIPNPEGVLRPGMFARATIETPTGTGSAVLAVPRGAIQDVEGRSVVWIVGDSPGEYRTQPVEVGEELGSGRVAIRSGIAPGTRIVTEGAFTLKSELMKGDFGGHDH